MQARSAINRTNSNE